MTRRVSHKPVLCVGRLYCDLVFTGAPHLPEMGKEVFAEGLSLHAGGGAFITAATLTALGVPTSLLATFPAKPFDEVVRRDLEKYSVNSEFCMQADPSSAPQLTVAMTGGQDRAFLTHKAGSAIPDAEFPTGRWGHLHIGELLSLVEHPNLISRARTAGMTISLDCGWDDDLLSQGAEMAELIAKTDLFLPNEAEFDRLCAAGMAEAVTKTVVVKCGQNGARGLHANHWISDPTDPVDVIDATGAGDAFNGGFLAEWLAGAPLDVCLSNGNACGAAAVQHTGGTGGLDKMRGRTALHDTATAE